MAVAFDYSRAEPFTLRVSIEPQTEFGRWLLAGLNRIGINQTALAIRADVGKSTISMYLKGERVPEDREIVARLAAGLSANVNEGLVAAGLAPDRPDLTLISDPRTLPEYREAPPQIQRAIIDAENLKRTLLGLPPLEMEPAFVTRPEIVRERVRDDWPFKRAAATGKIGDPNVPREQLGDDENEGSRHPDAEEEE